MKQNFTKIAIVLDRSGSMGAVREATIDGINEFLNMQKMGTATADIRINQFDDQFDLVYDGPVKDAPRFDISNYIPRGSTALFDAMGRTIDALGKDLALLAEEERPERVLVCVITDGHENCSSDYTQQRIRDMVTHQRDAYKWGFVFIGANQDAVLTAATFNIPSCNSISYAGTAGGTRNTMRSLGTYTQSFIGAAGAADAAQVAFTEQDRQDAMSQSTQNK